MIEKKASPMMQHYLQMKEQYKDCILFYRLGDFYEMFYEDAIEVSRALDLTLTEKACGLEQKAPMCGVPHHSADTYISRLIDMGYKVAICEQLTEPKPGVKVIERDVLRVITPGTVIEENMLEDKRNNYLLSIYKSGDKLGAAYVDISTGEFEVVPFTKNYENEFCDLFTRIMPAEIIGNEEAKTFYNNLIIQKTASLPKLYEYYNWAYSTARANENLARQFGENYAKIYELAGKNELILAAGACLEYLNETQKRLMGNINKIKLVKNSQFMTLDMNSRRNLELVENARDRKRYGSLLWLMDKTKTSMGGRRLRKYFDQPLQDSRVINARLDAVEELVKKIVIRDQLSEVLSNVRDIERIAGKLAFGSVNPRDLLALKQSLFAVPQIKETIKDCKSTMLCSCRDRLCDFSQVATLLENAISESAPSVLKEGNYIKDGFNKDLDDYRSAKSDGKKWIQELEEKERELTGIKNLVIGSNKVFGYYIEVNRSLSDRVPLRYERKQTIANNERYITEDLKIIEDKIFGAEEKAIKLESVLLAEIKKYLMGFVKSFQDVAASIAEIDCLLSLAVSAAKYNFNKPTINNHIKHIKITEGRHPVVEAFVNKGSFIANDTFLDEENDRTMIITGPNMAGKSTYMRQVAIITFLAHIGSFVPAKEAEIAITDRIFTRVGASDDLASGQSTFMVEMSEVATILANATNRSLILLDEIGRGTSTFDGLSIAWAVVEFVTTQFHSKTLFATHYHELTELEGILEGVKNYKIAVKEIDDNVVFLRKIVRGGANKSFGIEVARLAGVPKQVLDRAHQISRSLEKVNTKLDLNLYSEERENAEKNSVKANQLLLVLKDIDMNKVSPLHAFELLNDLVSRAKEGE